VKGILSAVLTLAGLVTGTVGCGDDPDASETTTPVTVVLDWTPNTNHSGVYLALRDGLYRDAGLDVRIVEPDQGGSVAPLASGRAAFAFSYSEEVLPRRAQGTPVVSIAAVLQRNTSSLVAPSDRSVTRPRHLEGKRYAGFGGPIERPIIEALVRCDGGDPAKVRFVEVGNVDYAVGFRRKAYDVIWAFDGWDVIRLRDVAGTPVTTIPLRGNRCVPNWYTPIIVTTEDRLERQPEMVRSFMAATAAGYEKASQDPAAAAAAIKDAVPESDRTLLEASSRFLAPFYVDEAGRFGSQDPAVWTGFNQFLRSNGLPAATESELPKAFTNDVLPSK
jgi:ABC-type nitrate/sulfonate/bicarbonate transport system substrate-binding protein